MEELADSAGLTRRAIRFYVQQELLPTPLGVGRGKHYDASHLERLRRVQQLQEVGHSLDAIRQILAGQTVPPPTLMRAGKVRPTLSAELWTRVQLANGIELHVDQSRDSLNAEQILKLREALREIQASGKR